MLKQDRVTAGARARVVAGLGAVLLTAGLTLGACTGNEEEPEPPASSPGAQPDGGAAAGESAVATSAALGNVTGRLRPVARTRVVTQVTAVVDGWMDAAFVRAAYPTTEFPGAFEGFTRGARREAVGDAVLMTNQALGDQIDGVEVIARQVRVDVLANRRRPAAVTARFRLGFRTVGDVTRRVTIRGRFLMQYDDSGWTVFGYNVSRGER